MIGRSTDLASRNSQSTNRDEDVTPTPGATETTARSGTTTSDPTTPTGQVADQVKQSASDVTEQAKQTATSQIAMRKDQAAQGLNAVSSSDAPDGRQPPPERPDVRLRAVRRSGRRSGGPVLRLSAARDPREIMSDAENWARRNPALVLGGAFALGLLASRFLKSGMGGQSQSSRSWQSGSREWPPVLERPVLRPLQRPLSLDRRRMRQRTAITQRRDGGCSTG